MNDFLPALWHTHYINLSHRQDRRTAIEAEFQRVGIQGQRFPALVDEHREVFPEFQIPASPRARGEYGCVCSHYAILRGHTDITQHLAIFEDDAHFCQDFAQRLVLTQDNLHDDWDIFLLGGFADISCYIPVNKYIYRVKYMGIGSHAILIHHQSINKVLQAMLKYAHVTCKADALYNHIFHNLNTFIFLPGMVSQDNIPRMGDIGCGRKGMTKEYQQRHGLHIFTETLAEYEYQLSGSV